MYKVLKPIRWFMRETGKTLEFMGKGVSECGVKLEDLGDDILKELERTGYIAKHTSNTGPAEPKIEPVELEEKPKKQRKRDN